MKESVCLSCFRVCKTYEVKKCCMGDGPPEPLCDTCGAATCNCRDCHEMLTLLRSGERSHFVLGLERPIGPWDEKNGAVMWTEQKTALWNRVQCLQDSLGHLLDARGHLAAANVPTEGMEFHFELIDAIRDDLKKPYAALLGLLEILNAVPDYAKQEGADLVVLPDGKEIPL